MSEIRRWTAWEAWTPGEHEDDYPGKFVLFTDHQAALAASEAARKSADEARNLVDDEIGTLRCALSVEIQSRLDSEAARRKAEEKVQILEEWIAGCEQVQDVTELKAKNARLTSRVKELEGALEKIMQRANESAPGEMSLINTIHDMHRIARTAKPF